jgi:SAM-dependent methyltransferase
MLTKSKKCSLKFIVHCELSALRLFSNKFRYQPAIGGSSVLPSSYRATRDCEDRLSFIKNNLPPSSKNLLDLGSNTGYYLFRLAELGLICHGVERDPDLVYFTNLENYLLNAKGVSCECQELDLSYIQKMPHYDVVLCLSLMHHIILAEGIGIAEEFLRGLAIKTNHVMFYEMGQSNESDADWSPRLPDMEPNPERWVSQWLKNCGFKKVKTLGTSLTSAPRYLFAAYP